MVPSVLGLLLLVALVVLALPLVRRRGRAARPVRPVTRPVCARCRYEVARVAGPRCPECGRDLETTGVVDHRDPPRRPLALARLTTLLLLAVVAWMPLVAAFDGLRPSAWTWTVEATVVELGAAGAPGAAAGPGAAAVPGTAGAPMAAGTVSGGGGPAADRLRIGRTRVRHGWREPDRADFGPGRVSVVLIGAADLELVGGSEAALAGRSAEDLAADVRRATEDTRFRVPADVAGALASRLARGLGGGDPRATSRRLRQVVAEAAGPRDVRVVGSRDDVVWRRRPAAWPPLAATIACGLGVALGLLVVVRDWRRGDPVPRSAATSSAPGPRIPGRPGRITPIRQSTVPIPRARR